MSRTQLREPTAPGAMEKPGINTERNPPSPSPPPSLDANPPSTLVPPTDFPLTNFPFTDNSPEVPPVPYTLFTSLQKRLLITVLVLTMLASPLTATIYLPLLPPLAQHFGVSIQAINLTITIYIVFQAISPLLFATASDSLGRRPIYLATYCLYTLASLGLALNKHSYVGLLVLRALQSLGASAVLAVAFGVVADVWPPAGRGSVLGPTQGAANLAVCVGPVVGGWIALASGGFRWVFWALTIFGISVWLIVGVALPETARNIVGNGSSERKGWERPWWEAIKKRKKRKEAAESDNAELGAQQPTSEKNIDHTESRETPVGRRKRFKLLNPLAAIRIIFWKDTALVLWMAASPYAVWYCVQTSIPPIYKNVYHFSELQVGLAYLAGGAGTVLGGYANGKLMDWNYRVIAGKIGHTIDKVSGDDLKHFPIERARARGGWYLLATYTCALVGYGWSVMAQTSAAVPLVLQFVLAALCTCFQQTYNALLVDIYPESPSTAAASSNITRCALSAVAVAVLQPLVDAMGRGWLFTFLAGLSGGGGMATFWAMTRYSMQWRQQRLLMMESRREK